MHRVLRPLKSNYVHTKKTTCPWRAICHKLHILSSLPPYWYQFCHRSSDIESPNYGYACSDCHTAKIQRSAVVLPETERFSYSCMWLNTLRFVRPKRCCTRFQAVS
ncbi:hypothetical protein RRG08_028722 [Elysia crispata]|uniref:Uncharacterized protein n=1 Tax=Elysia crispata TaxID=231223 RepID=A0AAE0XSJ1_9GAST|nr:hypothetical protein RRG08_028722 [Elysia crispata]